MVRDNMLVRVDVQKKISTIWSEEGCYLGEPVFADAPSAQAGDDGVVLSAVPDGRRESSFLLVLDAHAFEERGRAAVSHHIPFDSHDWFFISGPEPMVRIWCIDIDI